MSGAPIIAWISIDPDAFAITKGAPAHYASSPAISRQFCGACGAQLTYARDDDDSFLDVATATLGWSLATACRRFRKGVTIPTSALCAAPA
jgi:hypothetical protein